MPHPLFIGHRDAAVRRRRPQAVALARLAIVVTIAVGCGATPPSIAVVSLTPAVTPPSAPPATPDPAGPPVATISVEGGDPVLGQLGTYSWGGGGSSSPWLPGAPIAVAAQETLTVRLRPSVVVTEWTARIAPAGGDGSHAIETASGVGQPVMRVPPGGSWTLAVTMRFGPLGSATYAWRLDVT